MIGFATALVLLAACSDNEPELTIEQRLEAIEGRSLTPDEVAEKLATADALCQLDDQLVKRIWDKLDEDQFEFQEFTFNIHCPERNELIAGYVHSPTSAPSTTRPPGSTVTSPNSSDSTGGTGANTATTSSSLSTSSNNTSSSNTSSSNTASTSTAASSTTRSASTTSSSSARFGGPDSESPDSTRIGEGG